MTLNHVSCAPFCTFCAIFCAAPVLAGELSAQLPTHPSTDFSTQVTAVVLPDGRFSQVAIRQMIREAAQILKKSGVSLSWHLGRPVQSVEGLLVVVKLTGACDMDGAPVSRQPGPLGWSHEANGVVLPFSDLACDNIRATLQSIVPEGNQIRGNYLLGRAMGRVLAHELYHIVANTATHGADGVARSALSARDLTSGWLELRPPDVEAIQSGLRQAR